MHSLSVLVAQLTHQVVDGLCGRQQPRFGSYNKVWIFLILNSSLLKDQAQVWSSTDWTHMLAAFTALVARSVKANDSVWVVFGR